MLERTGVFISSTSRDLPIHRKEAMDACLRMGMFPIAMEFLSASDANAVKASLDMVNQSDIYIGIFAQRYGYVPKGYNKSVTELEYDCAFARGIPRLIFVMHDDHMIQAANVEKGIGAAKLEEFKQRILVENIVNFYKSPEDLRAQIIHALVPYRQPDIVTLHSSVASDIPNPPDPYVAHPYTLLQSKYVIGRENELSELTKWITDPTSITYQARVFNVVAIGGMGKSALTWKWFHEIAPTLLPHFAGRMWWSFYETDASFENFVIRALSYVTRQTIDDVRKIPDYEREEKLIQILNHQSYLIVLDGLERILIAYADEEIEKLSDKDLDKATAHYVKSNNMANITEWQRTLRTLSTKEIDWTEDEQQVVEDTEERLPNLTDDEVDKLKKAHRQRKTVDARAGLFLQKLTKVQMSRILISTRLYPADLQTETGYPIPGSHLLSLHGLTDDDALSLWYSFKLADDMPIQGSRNQLLILFNTFENYPLLIRILAGEVAQFRRAPGNYDEWSKANPEFNPFNLELNQVKTHILEYAMRGLPIKAQRILETIVIFNKPATYDTLATLFLSNKFLMSENELDQYLIDLEDRSLVGWDRRANRYDSHPVIRGIILAKLNPNTRHNIYSDLSQHFSEIAPVYEREVRSVDDLIVAEELFHALIGLRRYDDAFSIYLSRLHGPIFNNLNEYFRSVRWLEPLFDDGFDKPPHLGTYEAQTFAASALGLSLHFAGQLEEAIKVHLVSVKLANSKGDKEKLSVFLSNLLFSLYPAGRLGELILIARSTIYLDHKLSNIPHEINGLATLGFALATIGEIEEGKLELERAESLERDTTGYAKVLDTDAIRIRGLIYMRFAQIGLWEGNIHIVQKMLNRVKIMAQVVSVVRDFIGIDRMQGQVFLLQNDVKEAERSLLNALTQAREMSIIEEELMSLCLLAKCFIINHNFSEARARLNDVWELAERGPYLLVLADALNILTDLEIIEGHRDKAMKSALEAYRVSMLGGTSFIYYRGLETAKKHLDEMGISYPNPEILTSSEDGSISVDEIIAD